MAWAARVPEPQASPAALPQPLEAVCWDRSPHLGSLDVSGVSALPKVGFFTVGG